MSEDLSCSCLDAIGFSLGPGLRAGVDRGMRLGALTPLARPRAPERDHGNGFRTDNRCISQERQEYLIARITSSHGVPHGTC